MKNSKWPDNLFDLGVGTHWFWMNAKKKSLGNHSEAPQPNKNENRTFKFWPL